jgi:hypothetical protein
MIRQALLALALVCRAPLLAGAEDLPMAHPLPAGWSATPAPTLSVVPGREPPKGSAHEAVIEVAWPNYRTLIVISSGNGVLRPAIVLTYQDGGDLAVAYRASAYRDQQGILQIDARNAVISGPQSGNWSPDSFAVYGSGDVFTLDDQNSAQRGAVARSLAVSDAEYSTLVHRAESLVEDGS